MVAEVEQQGLEAAIRSARISLLPPIRWMQAENGGLLTASGSAGWGGRMEVVGAEVVRFLHHGRTGEHGCEVVVAEVVRFLHHGRTGGNGWEVVGAEVVRFLHHGHRHRHRHRLRPHLLICG